VPSVTIAEGKVCKGEGGLTIRYAGDERCPYGVDATVAKQDFKGIVIHYTGRDHDLDWYVKYQIKGDPYRQEGPRAHYGYHFYIGAEGEIVQGAPLTFRTNHVKVAGHAKRKQFRSDIENTNAIGITCVGAEASDESFKATQKQEDTVRALTRALCSVLNISFANVVGHGEIQTDRHETEGRDLAKEIRAW
jgi:N-acetyl-anhydromuramyl-L-alanine amidase AmpD